MTTTMNRQVQSWFQMLFSSSPRQATSRQELELLFQPSYAMPRTTAQEKAKVLFLCAFLSVEESHKVVRLGINPMIQPEPEDLPKDNPKLEIAVLRWQYAPASEY
ncbi:hypothetical protein Tco_1283884 [Tanacetum coccineum]